MREKGEERDRERERKLEYQEANRKTQLITENTEAYSSFFALCQKSL